jgi:uncharacterized protein
MKLKRYLIKISRDENAGSSVALAFAIGTLIAVLPTPGFGIFVGALLGYVFKNLNKMAIMAAFPIWNPLVLSPVYILSQKVGELAFDANLLAGNAGVFQKALFYSKTFLFGNFIFAMIISVISYFALHYGMKWFKSRKKQKLMNKLKNGKFNPNQKNTIDKNIKWPQSQSHAISA